MLKNKIIYILLCVLIVLSGCSSGSAPKIEPEIKPVIESEPPLYIKNAEVNFKLGKEALLNGNLEESKQYFDKVIDILMETGLKTPGQKDLINLYIAAISELEFSYLNERTSGTTEKHDSFMEEVISTPLFKPTKGEIQRVQEQMEKQSTVVRYSIPLTVNSTVVSFLKAFQNSRFKNIQNALNRSVEYIDEYKRIFREYNLPEDLAYLPMIESGYRIQATSRASACGIWQFMAPTARLFGLKVDWEIDERRDPYKSAVAAAKYLKRLYEDFGDWYIAMACYNGGERRVKRGINKLKTNDFFSIAKSKLIKKETRNYVPAFLAALIIAKDPESYGFKIEKSETIFENSKTVSIISPVSLKDVAGLANVPLDTIKELNPELVEEYTPFKTDNYDIRVPQETDETIFSQLQRLPSSKRIISKGRLYTVKRGDSLYSISRRFKTTVQKIKHINRMYSNRLKPGNRLMIPH